MPPSCCRKLFSISIRKFYPENLFLNLLQLDRRKKECPYRGKFSNDCVFKNMTEVMNKLPATDISGLSVSWISFTQASSEEHN